MHSEVVFELFVFKFNNSFDQFFDVTKVYRACFEIVLSSKEIIDTSQNFQAQFSIPRRCDAALVY